MRIVSIWRRALFVRTSWFIVLRRCSCLFFIALHSVHNAAPIFLFMTATAASCATFVDSYKVIIINTSLSICFGCLSFWLQYVGIDCGVRTHILFANRNQVYWSHYRIWFKFSFLNSWRTFFKHLLSSLSRCHLFALLELRWFS